MYTIIYMNTPLQNTKEYLYFMPFLDEMRETMEEEESSLLSLYYKNRTLNASMKISVGGFVLGVPCAQVTSGGRRTAQHGQCQGAP